MCGDDLIQTMVAVYMELVCPALKMHREDQSHQAQVMITVEVTDEDAVDAVEIDLKMHELHLHTFAAVHQEILILNFNELGRGEPPVRRQCTAGTQYRNFEIHTCIIKKRPKPVKFWSAKILSARQKCNN